MKSLFLSFFIAGSAAAQTYTYDDLGRMTRVAYADGSAIAYTYDDGGNLTGVQSLTVPAAPVLTGVTMLSETSALVSWQDLATGETGYVIQRRTLDADAWEDLGTAGPDATTYFDNGIVGGVGYVYRVYATGSGGNSANSNEQVYLGAAPVVISAFEVMPSAVPTLQQIRFPTALGLNYRLEINTSPGSSGWTPLLFSHTAAGPFDQTTLTGTGALLAVFVPAPAPESFIRVVAE